MLYTKENPVGIDKVIDKIQRKLYKELSKVWGVELEAFPRCYSQRLEDGQRVIKTFLGGIDYTSLTHRDKNKFLFLAENDIIQVLLSQYQTKLEMFFIVNLAECKPSIAHRADEEVRLDVLKVLQTISEVNIFVHAQTDVRNIFAGYDVKDNIDLHPWHCFKLTVPIHYYDPFK